MTNNYFEAEDLAQETFLAAYEHLEQFDGEHEKAWLCRIAMNKCLDFLKKDRRRVLPQEEIIFLDCVDTETVEGQVLAEEVKQELQKCCESLPSPYQEVAISYFCEEKDVAEIAAEQNRNLKTVQTQIYRARAKLQKLYGKEKMLWGKK